MKIWLTALLLALPAAVHALPDRIAQFASLDGGVIDLAGHAGPVLLVNTASLCAFTPQYDALQAVHERFAEDGLLVVAVPSDDFRQELENDAAVAEFCNVNFDLTLPIAQITSVTGQDAHPVFAYLRQEHAVSPRWNFHKFLIDGDELLGAWGSSVKPDARPITRAIEAALR